MVMLMIIVGGYGRFPGGFIGAFLVAFIGEILRPIDQFRFLVFGTIMILSILLMRKGLMGLIFDQILPFIKQRVKSER